MPMETGKARKPAPPTTAANTPLSARKKSPTMIVTNAKASPKATHLICCRSMPVARRNRRNKEPTDTKKINGNSRPIAASMFGRRLVASTKNGFGTLACSFEPDSDACPMMNETLISARKARMNNRNGRHRGDGRWPSGKTSGRTKITGRIPKSQPKLLTSANATTNPPVFPRSTSQVASSPPRKLLEVISAP